MRWTIAFLLAAAVGASSCAKKTRPAGGAAGAASAQEEKETEVGVGDVVDYAIGKKQLEAKKKIESRLERIQADRNKQLKEAGGK